MIRDLTWIVNMLVSCRCVYASYAVKTYTDLRKDGHLNDIVEAEDVKINNAYPRKSFKIGNKS